MAPPKAKAKRRAHIAATEKEKTVMENITGQPYEQVTAGE
jgi:hypothetical protein